LAKILTAILHLRLGVNQAVALQLCFMLRLDYTSTPAIWRQGASLDEVATQPSEPGPDGCALLLNVLPVCWTVKPAAPVQKLWKQHTQVHTELLAAVAN
jgi:hypothetical protein